MMYIDAHLIVNTHHIVCAHKVQGSNEHDGCYAIALRLWVEGMTKKEYADFPDKETRDAAFVALGEKLQEAEYTLTDLDDDTDA